MIKITFKNLFRNTLIIVNKFSASTTNSNIHNSNRTKSSNTQDRKFRNKFINDYLYFKAFPASYRQQQLYQIIFRKPYNRQYKGKLITCSGKESTFQYQGKRIATYAWQPEIKKALKGVIVNYHSLNGHTMMVSEFAQRIAHSGYATVGMDYPNFGKSENNNENSRGDIPTLQSIIKPSERFFYHIKKKYPHTKIYIMGNSLGGNVAFNLANKIPLNQLNGLILLSPALRENRQLSPIQKRIGMLIALLMPKFRLPKSSSRNGSRLLLTQYIKTDPYLYTKGMWTSTLWTMLTAMYDSQKKFSSLTTPYLIVQSGNDKLVDPFLAIDLQRQSKSTDKTTVIIRDMWHNIWFDDRRNDVMKIIEEWLSQR